MFPLPQLRWLKIGIYALVAWQFLVDGVISLFDAISASVEGDSALGSYPISAVLLVVGVLAVWRLAHTLREPT